MEIVGVEFKGDIVEIIDECVSVKRICENLGIAHRPQFVKIQTDPSYGGRMVNIEINGIVQNVLCIPVDKLNGWLFSINTSKVKDSIKDKLIAYKNECFIALNDYFNKGIAIKSEVKVELENIILQQNETIAQLSKKIGEGTVFSAMEYNFIFELIGQVSRNIQEDETMELILRKRRTIMQNFLRGLVSSTKNKGILEQAKRESNEVYFHALRSQEECFGCMVSNKSCGSTPAPVKKRGTSVQNNH